MKKITITVDAATLANLEILRYYFWSNNSSLVRRAIFDLYASIYTTDGYDDAIRKYRENHPELFGGSGA